MVDSMVMRVAVLSGIVAFLVAVGLGWLLLPIAAVELVAGSPEEEQV